MISAPMIRWISITFSGVNRCLEPSICERNMAPSSCNLRFSEREKTWKPPLSVRIGRFHVLNLCNPPACSNISNPGRRYKWYVFPKMICALISSSNSVMWTPLTVPCVPTGIKIGVSITPWSVVIRPALAFDFVSLCCNSNFMAAKIKKRPYFHK